VNERSITVEVLKDLRGRLTGSEVLKHMDTGTRGIPDISVHFLDRWSGVELKHQKRGKSLKEICDGAQLSLCHRLGVVHGGRSWVVVYEDEPHQVTVWQPRALFARLWPRVAGPGEWSTIGTDPVTCSLKDFLLGDPLKVLSVHGAITVDTWSYSIPTILVLKAVNP
jgi:hypothetical protein